MKTRLEFDHDGRVAHVFLAAPKANILDREMVIELEGTFQLLEAQHDVCAIIIEGEGPHFSFGASVEEHLPDEIAGALARLGALLRRVAAAHAPTIAAVRGQCLGGGFELALACDLIIADETAHFGAPEIRLGVFPPAASALLPVRIGVAGSSELILSGASWGASRAMVRGLVAKVAAVDGLDGTVDEYVIEHFLPRSATALRHAARAVRLPVVRALEHDLPVLEALYLGHLMRESDAIEGIRAFLEKREPRWSTSRKATV